MAKSMMAAGRMEINQEFEFFYLTPVDAISSTATYIIKQEHGGKFNKSLLMVATIEEELLCVLLLSASVILL